MAAVAVAVSAEVVELKDTVPKEDAAWVIDHSHLSVTNFDWTDDARYTDVSANELLKILEAVEVKEEDVSIWSIWSGRLTVDKNDLRSRLRTVIDYAESARDECKNRLRFVTKLLLENPKFDKVQILLLLAAHGQVCNVQKEVGISTAFHLMTNSLVNARRARSLSALILTECFKLREMCVEELFIKKHGKNLNTHPLTGYRNGMAAEVGLPVIPDEHVSTSKDSINDVNEFFSQHYTVERILGVVHKAIHTVPRLIPLETVTNWLRDHAIGDAYEFLESAFDENGCVRPMFIFYMLEAIGIVKVNDGGSSKPEPAKEAASVPASPEGAEKKGNEIPVTPEIERVFKLEAVVEGARKPAGAKKVELVKARRRQVAADGH